MICAVGRCLSFSLKSLSKIYPLCLWMSVGESSYQLNAKHGIHTQLEMVMKSTSIRISIWCFRRINIDSTSIDREDGDFRERQRQLHTPVIQPGLGIFKHKVLYMFISYNTVCYTYYSTFYTFYVLYVLYVLYICFYTQDVP